MNILFINLTVHQRGSPLLWKLLCHRGPEVTSQMYADLEVGEIREAVDDAVSDRGG
jgi:hypothetical protein